MNCGERLAVAEASVAWLSITALVRVPKLPKGQECRTRKDVVVEAASSGRRQSLLSPWACWLPSGLLFRLSPLVETAGRFASNMGTTIGPERFAPRCTLTPKHSPTLIETGGRTTEGRGSLDSTSTSTAIGTPATRAATPLSDWRRCRRSCTPRPFQERA